MQPQPTKKRLGDFLLEEGLIDRFQLQAALAEQKKWGGRLGKHLIELGILSEEVLVKVLSKLLSLPSVDVGRLSIARNVIEYVQAKTAEKFNLIPIGIEESPGGKKTIIVAMSDPTNLAALDELRFTSGCNVRPVVSGDTSIERAIKSYYYGQVAPQTQQGVRRTGPSSAGTEIVIMNKGEPVTIRMDAPEAVPVVPPPPRVSSTAGAVPMAPPPEIASLPPHALTSVDATAEENARKINALLRVLIKRNLITEAELLAELAKG